MYKTQLNEAPQIVTTTRNAKIGDLMCITEKGLPYTGDIILKVYEIENIIYFISLTNPENVWESDPNFEVRFLQPGESVTLTVE